MGDLQSFFESTTGKATTCAVIAALLLIIFLIGRSGDSDKGTGSISGRAGVKAMSVSALLVAFSFALSFLTIIKMPMGGLVTLCSMLPIALCSYLFGTRNGIIAGASLGLINLILDPYVIHPLQLIIDYPLAFAALGAGGPLRNTKAGLPGVYLVGIFGRFIFATLSGVVFFSSYAEGTGMNPLVYSMAYNATYIGAEGAITIIILLLPPVRKTLEHLKEQLDY